MIVDTVFITLYVRRYEADEDGHYPDFSFMSGRKSIDLLYLDNTYCDPRCKFPTRVSLPTQEGHVVGTCQEAGSSHEIMHVYVRVCSLP